MEITKIVPVTIRAHGDKCKFACKWMSPPLFCGGRFCNYFHVKIRGKRCTECVAEFGTGENHERQFVIDDDQMWAAIQGLQAAVRECEFETASNDDPEQSQQDCNWFTEHLTRLWKIRENQK